MRLNLLEIICCSVCRSSLRVSTSHKNEAGELLEGLLSCIGCGQTFSVARGIPDLLAGKHHRATADAFSFQWRLSFRGWFESSSRYFCDINRLVDWLFVHCFSPVTPGDWMLDAGCGHGDKTIEIARRHPHAQVVGLDLTDTLYLSRKLAEGLDNIHFVRGDLLNPPIRRGVLAKAISWGVLHHTPDTHRAFRSVAEMIRPSGELAVWLYPHPDDSNLLDMAYEMRDAHFRGRAHHIPAPLLAALVPFYILLSGPYFLIRYRNLMTDPRLVRLGWLADKLSIAEKARALWFVCLDNLLPQFQDRPRREAVSEWYAENGFTGVFWSDPGVFWSKRSSS